MGYRIRVVPEVEAWLAELRGADPPAAGLVDDALDLLSEAGAGLGGSGPGGVGRGDDPDPDPGAPYPAGPTLTAGGSGPAPDLSELRPGAPERTGIRILFAVRPPDTAVLLGAGTERDWLNAWYAEVIQRCRDRYERDQGSTG